MKKPAYLIFVIILFAFTANVFAQAVTFESAKANYDAKEYKKAAEDFKKLSKTDKNNANVWNYLGLSYRAIAERADATSSFARAVELAPENNSFRFNYAVVLSEVERSSDAEDEIGKILKAEPENKAAIYLRGSIYVSEGELKSAGADADRLIELDPTALFGYSLRSDILEREMNRRIISRFSNAQKEIGYLQEAVAILETGLAKCGDCADKGGFEYKIEIRRLLLTSAEKMSNIRTQPLPAGTAIQPGPNDRPLKVISRPKPDSTIASRRQVVNGKLLLYVVFGASGSIEGAIIRTPLGYGLDENTLKVIRQIKFMPQIKNGKPISVIRIVEYAFTTKVN